MALWVIIGIIVLIAIIIAGTYNRLVSLKVRSEEAWSDIEVQMKRRYDLIPNLVETVKGYASHEKKVFDDVTNARAEALSAKGVASKNDADNQVSSALKSIFAVSEAYPELKANQNFLDLQAQLTDTEDKIQASRRFYNANVRDLNIAVKAFPSNMVASMFHFDAKNLFELDEAQAAAKEPVKAKFD